MMSRNNCHFLVSLWLLASLPACDGAAESQFPTTLAHFVRIECENDHWQGLRSLTLARPADAIAWRVRYKGAAPSDLAPPSGEPCSKASDRAACEHAWNSAAESLVPRPDPACEIVSCNRYFLLNRGDSVELKTPDQMLAELAPIDSMADATLAGMLAQYGMPCRGGEHGFVRTVPEGFELIGYRVESRVPESLTDLLPEVPGAIIQYLSPLDARNVLLRVSPQGQVEELASKRIESR